MMNKKVFLILIVLWIVSSSHVYAAGKRAVSVSPTGKTTITAGTAKVKIKVEVLTHEVEIKEADRDNLSIPVTSCTYSRLPCSVVDRLIITVNGNSVIVPSSVVLDLADINTAELKITKTNYALRFTGGDASESYTAIITFDSKHVQKKRIYSGEGGRLLQETVYHLVIIN